MHTCTRSQKPLASFNLLAEYTQSCVLSKQAERRHSALATSLSPGVAPASVPTACRPPRPCTPVPVLPRRRWWCATFRRTAARTVAVTDTGIWNHGEEHTGATGRDVYVDVYVAPDRTGASIGQRTGGRPGAGSEAAHRLHSGAPQPGRWLPPIPGSGTKGESTQRRQGQHEDRTGAT